VDEVAFGRYRLIELIGEGGMGKVFKAHDTEMRRNVAIKVLPPELATEPGYRERFEREAYAAARLTEPHIIPIHDSGEIDGRLYLVMPVVDGIDVASLLERDGPMSPQLAVKVIEQLASALDAAHVAGLVHRDVKPSNALMTGRGFVYLIDFGIAHDSAATKLTSTGTIVGTMAYMAPERFTAGVADARSDVYALACVLHECLTGDHPYPGGSMEQQIAGHLTLDPPRPSARRPALPPAFDEVVARGLAKDPDRRYQTALDLAVAAEQALAEPVSVSAANTVPAVVKPTPRPGQPRNIGPRSDGIGKGPKQQLASTARAPQQPPPRAPSRSPQQPVRPAHARWIIAGVAALVVLIAAAIGIRAIAGHRTPQRGPTSQSTVSKPAAAPAPPLCSDPTAVPASLSLPEKLAQLLMVGVKNSDDARAVVTSYHVGGIFIGSWTDLSIFKGPLADIVGSTGKLPLAVSVDEEGGRVSRLKSLIGAAPSPRVLAQTKSPQQVHDLALSRGQAMKKLGITVDFAPVVDVTDAPDDTVIGDRSFSSDPDKVTAYAGAYAQGLRDAGVLPVLKHFPGHGHGSGDSHTGGVVTPPLSDLQTNDLVPYRTLVTQTPVAVMVGHLQVPGLTGDDPASLSRAAVQLLRTGTGYGAPPFDGPIFSDDLSSMAAISDRFGVSEAVLRTLQAGTDIALWVTTDEVPAVLDRLEKAVNAGELQMQAVDESVVRVAKMKGVNPGCGR
jgi:beta-N-acetylhexosaminidase